MYTAGQPVPHSYNWPLQAIKRVNYGMSQRSNKETNETTLGCGTSTGTSTARKKIVKVHKKYRSGGGVKPIDNTTDLGGTQFLTQGLHGHDIGDD